MSAAARARIQALGYATSPFRTIPGTHFARLAVLDRRTAAFHPRHTVTMRNSWLLFAVDFDGDFANEERGARLMDGGEIRRYLRAIDDVPALRNVWSDCFGFRSHAAFEDLLEPSVVERFVLFRDHGDTTLAEIVPALELKRWFVSLLGNRRLETAAQINCFLADVRGAPVPSGAPAIRAHCRRTRDRGRRHTIPGSTSEHAAPSSRGLRMRPPPTGTPAPSRLTPRVSCARSCPCRGHDPSCPPPRAASASSEYHFLPMARGSDSGHDSEERDPETEWLFPSDVRSDSAAATNSTTADPPSDAGDWIAEFEKAAFGVDNSPAFRTDTADRTNGVSGIAPATAEAFEEMPPARRSRKWVVVFAAIVVLLAVAAVGVVAGVGRNGGAKPSQRVAPRARSEASTSTTSRAEVTTTITPAPTPSAPISFTVHSSCSGRDCEVAVRERPSTAAKTVRSLRSGDAVQISCSTHGDRIDDRDTGQQSDVWYRLAGTGGYSSALYLEGPPVQDCG